jgi:TolA-binding protein
MRTIAAVSLWLTVIADPAGAQNPRTRTTDPQLAAVDSLIDLGRVTTARESLARWNADHPASDAAVPSENRAFATLLSGKLATTWQQAEQAFQTLALTWPVSAFASEALLRLAQGLITQSATALARNSADRAASYLERLIADYPTSPHRPPAFYWLAQAYLLSDRTPLACARLNTASSIALDSITAELTRSLQRRVCAGPSR